ncbi:hypothetical protein Ancab_033552 [Ancistrocladus abbreviatus]
MYESLHDKTWRFIQHHLFPSHSSQDDEDDGVEFELERTFRVIDAELKFLYDYFYTKYYAVYARGMKKKSIQLGILILFCWLVTMKAKKYLDSSFYDQCQYHALKTGVTFTWIAEVVVEKQIHREGD